MYRVALDQTRADARTARSVAPALDPNEDDGPMTHLGVDATQEQRCEASDLYCHGVDVVSTSSSPSWRVTGEQSSAFADPTICYQRAKMLDCLTSPPVLSARHPCLQHGGEVEDPGCL